MIVVLGAGPAGLTLGYELARRDLPYRILEAGEVGESWARMPTRWKTISPWWSNRLPGPRSDGYPAAARVSREGYRAYLAGYAERHRLRVETGRRVEAVARRPGGGFTVRTADGEVEARFVANATGYFSKPYVPEIAGAGATRIPRVHVAAYGDPERLAGLARGRRALVVGGRISAGQVVVELADAGFEVALSHRGRLRFGPPPWLTGPLFPLLPALEKLVVGLGLGRRDTFARMEGGRARELIERGAVATFPEIAEFGAREVVFVDGRRERFDAVVFATGFRPALDHLRGLVTLDAESGLPRRRGFESAEVEGLFFLGLDHLRNFRSRFLRGLREDAPRLAAELERRSETTP